MHFGGAYLETNESYFPMECDISLVIIPKNVINISRGMLLEVIKTTEIVLSLLFWPPIASFIPR